VILQYITQCFLLSGDPNFCDRFTSSHQVLEPVDTTRTFLMAQNSEAHHPQSRLRADGEDVGE